MDALRIYEEYLDRRLGATGLSDDELADLANDRQYVGALHRDLQNRHDVLTTGGVTLRN